MDMDCTEQPLNFSMAVVTSDSKNLQCSTDGSSEKNDTSLDSNSSAKDESKTSALKFSISNILGFSKEQLVTKEKGELTLTWNFNLL